MIAKRDGRQLVLTATHPTPLSITQPDAFLQRPPRIGLQSGTREGASTNSPYGAALLSLTAIVQAYDQRAEAAAAGELPQLTGAEAIAPIVVILAIIVVILWVGAVAVVIMCEWRWITGLTCAIAWLIALWGLVIACWILLQGPCEFEQ